MRNAHVIQCLCVMNRHELVDRLDLQHDAVGYDEINVHIAEEFISIVHCVPFFTFERNLRNEKFEADSSRVGMFG